MKFLVSKDETNEVLIIMFKKMMNETSSSIAGIRSENGTEFTCKEVEDICEEKGIHHQVSAPRTPEQNGIAERKNRTLIEAGRTMLAEANLP